MEADNCTLLSRRGVVQMISTQDHINVSKEYLVQCMTYAEMGITPPKKLPKSPQTPTKSPKSPFKTPKTPKTSGTPANSTSLTPLIKALATEERRTVRHHGGIAPVPDGFGGVTLWSTKKRCHVHRGLDRNRL